MNPHIFLSNTEFPAYREQGNSAFSFSRFGIIIIINSVCTFTILVFGTMQKICRPDVNHERPDVQAGFRKDRGTRGQIANIHWIMEKAKEFQKNISALLTMPKPLMCGSPQTVENSERDGNL